MRKLLFTETPQAIEVRRDNVLLLSCQIVCVNSPKTTVSQSFSVVSPDEIEIRWSIRPTTELKNLEFKGVQFKFKNKIRGLLTPSHPTDYADAKIKWQSRFHPSHRNPTGGVYCEDGEIGFGLYLPDLQNKPKAFAFPEMHYASAKDVNLHIATRETAPARRTTFFRLRVKIGGTDFKELLSSYKSTLPELQYIPNLKPIVQFAHADKAWVSETNPLGFNDGGTQKGGRRFDTVEAYHGPSSWLNAIKPILDGCNATGVIMWCMNGYEKFMYRTNHDAFVPQVSKFIPDFIKSFTSANYTVGLCARPCERAFPLDGKDQEAVRLDPTNAFDLNESACRFVRSHIMGFRSYYLDVTGLFGSDLVFVANARAIVGQEVPMYSEFLFDLMMQYTGAYIEVWRESPNSKIQYTMRSVEQVDALRYFYPEVPFLAVARENVSLKDLLTLGFVPVLNDYDVNQTKVFK